MAICYDIHSRMHRYWHVYQFDPLQKYWTRIQSLGDRVSILQDSKIASIAVHAAKEFVNMILYVEWNCSTYICQTSDQATWRLDQRHT